MYLNLNLYLAPCCTPLKVILPFSIGSDHNREPAPLALVILTNSPSTRVILVGKFNGLVYGTLIPKVYTPVESSSATPSSLLTVDRVIRGSSTPIEL